MLIYDSSTGVVREMTAEEEQIANNMPDPTEQATAEEILSILTGETA